MTIKRFSKLLLVVLALALWAGTANAQPAVTTPLASLTYVSGGGGSNVLTTTSTTSGTGNGAVTGDVYTSAAISNYIVVSGGATSGNPTAWVTAASSTGLLGDTITYSLVTTNAASSQAGTYQATVTITDSNDSNVTASTTVTLVVTSPLSATPSSQSLTAFIGQASATFNVTVTNTDSSFDSYTVVPTVYSSSANTGCPTYFTYPNTHTPLFEAKSGAPSNSDVLAFTLNATGLLAGVTTTGCSMALQYNGATFATIAFPNLYIIAQPLKITANPTPGLAYVKGTGATAPGTSTVYIKSNITPAVSFSFNLDVATVAPWLSLSSGVTPLSAGAPPSAFTGTTTGDQVVFAINTAVASGMTTGNYTAQVGFYVTGSAEFFVPFTLQVSNGTPSVVVSQGTAAVSQTSSMGVPQSTATIYSTNEPVPFTATCLATPSASYPTKTTGFGSSGCLMNGTVASGATPVVSGTAFTWGFPLTVTLDPLLFAPTVLIGNTVTVTITFSGLQAGTTVPPAVSYVYTIQPGTIPGPLTVSPTSVAAGFKTSGSSFTVLVTGTNFVGPGSLVPGGTVVGTQVWLGTPAVLLTSSNTATLGSYVVIDASHMQVTIVGSALPAAPAAGKTASIAIAVANQTASPTAPPSASTASVSLNVTNNPVIYGITSTASYSQPAVGGNPSFAAYDLISIFGDNFGFTGLVSGGNPVTLANATYDPVYGKVVTPLTLGTAAAAGSKPVTLAVKFVDVLSGKIIFTAPVLFANQNQINAIVPAAIAGNQYVSVTAAGATSDNFLVGVVPADPGIFTLNSDGTGGGAIVNADGTINQSGHAAIKSTEISMYLAGLGAPDSTGLNMATSNVQTYPASCIQALGGSAQSPSLLSVKNTTVKVGSVTTYASPAWTNIDGAIMNYDSHDIILGTSPDQNFPPCMATATIAVTIGTPGVNSFTVTTPVTGIAYAGFVGGSVAGLYQINVVLPDFTTVAGSVTANMHNTVQPISVSIQPGGTGTIYTTQSGVTIQF